MSAATRLGGLLVVMATVVPCTVRANDTQSEHEARLDDRLRRAHKMAARWHGAWTGLFVANTAVQGVLVGVGDDANERWGQAVGAVPPAVGLTLQLAMPLAALELEKDLERIEGFDEAKLAAAKQALLRAYAASENEQRNAFAHIGPILLNASAALVLWLALDRPEQAAIQLGAGIAVSEARVWTSPTTAMDAFEHGWTSENDVTITPALSVEWFGLAGRF